MACKCHFLRSSATQHVSPDHYGVCNSKNKWAGHTLHFHTEEPQTPLTLTITDFETLTPAYSYISGQRAQWLAMMTWGVYLDRHLWLVFQLNP